MNTFRELLEAIIRPIIILAIYIQNSIYMFQDPAVTLLIRFCSDKIRGAFPLYYYVKILCIYAVQVC